MATAASDTRTDTPARGERGLFARKPTRAVLAEGSGEHGLRRAVGALDLTALGLGAIIGTGIFVIVGEAIGKTGPSIILSFVLAGVTCVFSALSYSELASTIPVSGSAYTYGYCTLGELLGWIIGWDLVIEYGFSIAVVAVGWGGYIQDLLNSLFGISLPDAIAQPPGEGGTINLPAVLLVLGVMGVLLAGVRESARTNTIMVITKVAILVMFIVLAGARFKGTTNKPFTTIPS